MAVCLCLLRCSTSLAVLATPTPSSWGWFPGLSAAWPSGSNPTAGRVLRTLLVFSEYGRLGRLMFGTAACGQETEDCALRGASRGPGNRGRSTRTEDIPTDREQTGPQPQTRSVPSLPSSVPWAASGMPGGAHHTALQRGGRPKPAELAGP